VSAIRRHAPLTALALLCAASGCTIAPSTDKTPDAGPLLRPGVYVGYVIDRGELTHAGVVTHESVPINLLAVVTVAPDGMPLLDPFATYPETGATFRIVLPAYPHFGAQVTRVEDVQVTGNSVHVLTRVTTEYPDTPDADTDVLVLFPEGSHVLHTYRFEPPDQLHYECLGYASSTLPDITGETSTESFSVAEGILVLDPDREPPPRDGSQSANEAAALPD
jgi:hypothetical protein